MNRQRSVRLEPSTGGDGRRLGVRFAGDRQAMAPNTETLKRDDLGRTPSALSRTDRIARVQSPNARLKGCIEVPTPLRTIPIAAQCVIRKNMLKGTVLGVNPKAGRMEPREPKSQGPVQKPTTTTSVVGPSLKSDFLAKDASKE